MPRVRVCQQAYLSMPRDRGGIGRTGKKRKKSEPPGSSHTSPQVLGAQASAVVEAPAAAGAAEQAPSTFPSAMDEEKSSKRVRFDRNPPRVTGIRRVRPVSDPWTWGGVYDFPSDHPRWSRNQDGTPREVDLQHPVGKMALCAHRWGLLVAEHVAGGFTSQWPGDDYYDLDFEWKRSRTHRRWCPKTCPSWRVVCAAGAVRYVHVVSTSLTMGVVDGSVRVKCVLKVL